MNKTKFLIFVATLVCVVPLYGQTRSEMREMFLSAEGDILFEDYAEALPKYLNLIKIYPDNYNFQFRVGQCYLNTPGEKDKAIPFLEAAAGNINPSYHRGRFSEAGAPYDVLYYLANAYRINNDLTKALETYDRFMKDVDTEVYDTNIVRFQIRSCHTAREMMRKPVYVVEYNIGSPVNDRFSETNPVISSDGRSLVFSRKLQFYDAVFWSRLVDGKWSEPVNLTPQLGIDQDYYPVSLSADGMTLLLYRTDMYDGNIYLSRLNNGTWSNVRKLNEFVNTKYWESHATMSRDGRRLYFTSNRKESLGGLDIFVSERDSSGLWGPAVNLGPVINTIYNEETPFLANNDRTLFFSSRGHNNMGGYDIFRSDLDDEGHWSEPVNVGYPVNTTDDDLFFDPMGKGDSGYISKYSDEGFGRMDIFRYDIYSERNPRKFFITGKVGVNNLSEMFASAVTVKAVNRSDGMTAAATLSDPLTGEYAVTLGQGSYTLVYDAEDAASVSRALDMPLDYGLDTVHIAPLTLGNNDRTAWLVVHADSVIKVSSPDPVLFPLSLESRSMLAVDIFRDDTLVYSERHIMRDTAYLFSMLPSEGLSRVIFTLTDRFGNTATAAAKVIRKDPPGKDDYTGWYKPLPAANVTDSAPVAQPPQETVMQSDTTGTSAVNDLNVASHHGKGRCAMWWILIIGLLIILFLLFKRRSDKEKEKDE